MVSSIIDRNGGTFSSSAAVDRNTGLASSAAVKAPVRSLSTTPITLSGTQTVANVALVADDRCGVGGQADTTLNGIYIVSSGAWSRAPDFNRNDDVFNGTLVVVGEGTNAGIWGVVCATSPAVIGTTAIALAAFPAVAGYAALASPAFTGNPTAPTQSAGNNSTRLATTAFVTAAVAVLAAATTAAIAAISTAFSDAAFFIVGSSDATKKLRFEVDGLTTGNTRVATPPDSNFIMAALDVANQVVSGGARVTSNAAGTISSGTTTLDPGSRPMWDYTNNGAHTLAPGTNKGSIILDITNGASAGAITTSGWTKVVGAFDTTNGHKFRCSCTIGAAGSLLSIQALQ